MVGSSPEEPARLGFKSQLCPCFRVRPQAQGCDLLGLPPHPYKESGTERASPPSSRNRDTVPHPTRLLEATGSRQHIVLDGLECEVLPSQRPCADNLLGRRGDVTSSLLVRQAALLGKGSALNTKGQSVAGRGREWAVRIYGARDRRDRAVTARGSAPHSAPGTHYFAEPSLQPGKVRMSSPFYR